MLGGSGIVVRIGGLCGIAAPLVGFGLVMLSVYYSSWFDWGKNALSDLGVGGAALLFNLGLVAAGVLEGMYALGLWAAFRELSLGRAAAVALGLDGFFLSSVGVFPESTGSLHFSVSVGFFVFLAVSIVLLGAGLLVKYSRTAYGVLSIASVVVGVTVWLAPHDGVAVPESVSGVIGAVWSILSGARMLARGGV